MSKKLTLNEFLDRAKNIHPEYDYSLVTEYKNNNTKIPVICHEKDFAGREHGVFMISPSNLLYGKGCNKCHGMGFTNEDRKLFCSILHNNKYDYSESDFSDVKKKTTIICPIHGKFKMNYDSHFNKKTGCKYCCYPVRDLKTFIEEATKRHNGFYNYDKFIYVNSHTKGIITCPIHGDFPQSPNAHLRGEGCPECKKTSILEYKVEKILNENSIKHVKDKRTKWLITDVGGHSHLDFFIPEINLAIECQGKQHFGEGGWNEKYDFENTFKIDKWKREQCTLKNINIVYFTEKRFSKKYKDNYLGEIFYDCNELLDYIKYLFKNKK